MRRGTCSLSYQSLNSSVVTPAPGSVKARRYAGGDMLLTVGRGRCGGMPLRAGSKLL